MRSWPWLLAFSIGCLVLPLFPVLPHAWLLSTLVAVLMLLSIKWKSASWLAACAVGLLLSSVTAQRALDNAWPQARDGETIAVTGRISGITEVRGRQFRFDLLPAEAKQSGLPRRIQVSWFQPARWPQAGEIWHMDLRLRVPDGAVNPGAFDYRRWMLSERIGATATVDGSAVRIKAAGSKHLLPAAVTRTRQRLAQWLQAQTIDLEAAALQRALGIADRGGISPPLRERLQRTGTAHLLAISGLHVGMVFGVAAGLGGMLGSWLSLINVRLDRRRVALIIGLMAAAGYACLAGFTLPTRRALVMLIVLVGAFLTRRGLRPGHALLLALVAVLLFDPLAPLATGFWLSFAAVAVLIWGFAWRSGRWGWWSGLLRAQLLIAIGMLPLSLGVFQQWVPAAIPANLLAIPLVGFWILPMLLVAMIMELFGVPYSHWPLQASEQGLVWLTAWLGWLDTAPAGWWPAFGGGGLGLAIAMVGALWLIAPRGIPGRWLGLAMLLPLLVKPDTRPDVGELDVWVLDAGSGFAVLLRTRHENWLFDTGRGDGQGRDQIANMLAPVLRRHGIGRLDGLVLSHANRNHTGGVFSVLERWTPETIYAGPGLEFEPCLAGHQWRVDGVSLRFLHPGPGLPDLRHDSACVLVVDTAGGRVLIAGAVGPAVGNRLARFEPDVGADVLITSGARLRTSPDFIAATAPTWWISGSEVSQDFTDTNRCGAIRVRLRAGAKPRVDAWRNMERRFWRSRCEV